MSKNIFSARHLAFMALGAVLALQALILLMGAGHFRALLPNAILLCALGATALFAFNGRRLGKHIFVVLSLIKPTQAIFFLTTHHLGQPFRFNEKIFLIISGITFFMAFLIGMSKDIDQYVSRKSLNRVANTNLTYTGGGVLWVFWSHLNIAYVLQGIFILTLFIVKGDSGDGLFFHLYFLLPYSAFVALPTIAVAFSRGIYLVKKEKLIGLTLVNIILLPPLTILFTVLVGSLVERPDIFELFILPNVLTASVTTILRVWLTSTIRAEKINGYASETISVSDSLQLLLKKRPIIKGATATAICFLYVAAYFSSEYALYGPKSKPISTSKPIAEQRCFKEPTPECVVDLAAGLLPELIESEHFAKTQSEVAQAYFSLGNTEAALALVSKVMVSDPYSIYGLSKILVDYGEYDLALKALKKSEKASRLNWKDSQLFYVIPKFAEGKDYVGFVELTQMLDKFRPSEKYIYPDFRNMQLSVAKIIVDNNDAEKVVDLLIKAAATDDSDMHFQAALILAQDGQQKNATEILDKISARRMRFPSDTKEYSPWVRKRLQLANYYVLIGLPDKAETIFYHAVSAVETKPDDYKRRYALTDIAGEAARFGFAEIAFATTAKISDVSKARYAASTVLENLPINVDKDDFDRGVRKLKRQSVISEVFKHLPIHITDSNGVDLYFRPLDLIDKNNDRDAILAMGMSNFAQKGLFDAAVRSWERIGDSRRKANTQSSLSYWAAHAGNIDLAVKYYQEGQRSGDIHQELAKQGYLDLAIKLSNDTTKDEESHLQDLRAFIRIALDAGQTELATTLIEQFQRQLLTSSTRHDPKYGWYSSLSEFYLKIGLQENALKAVQQELAIKETIKVEALNYSERERFLIRKAMMIAVTSPERGLAFIDSIKGVNAENIKIEGLVSATEYLARYGKNESAKAYLNRAREIIIEQDNKKRRRDSAKRCEIVATAFAKEGALDEAISIVDLINSDGLHKSALIKVLNEAGVSLNDPKYLEVLWLTRRTEDLLPELLKMSREMTSLESGQKQKSVF